jgi:hypothetical protein
MSLTAFSTLLALLGCADKQGDGDTAPSDDTQAVDPGVDPVDNDYDGYDDEEDCDDADATTYPGAEEDCDDEDNDCDGVIDEEPVGLSPRYADGDGDGYGDPASALTDCDPPEGYVEQGGDCDDGDDGVHPGAGERCDELDQDCDDVVDEDPTDASTWYADSDGDSYIDLEVTAEACEAPDGFVDGVGALEDCDDSDGDIHPGAQEVCNGVDDDCDALVDADDEDLVDLKTGYYDGDGDGYGAGEAVEACELDEGYVEEGGDCDDDPLTGAEIYPGADEYCDEVDNDCDVTVDEDAVDVVTWYLDDDGDGFGDGSGTESCDRLPGQVEQDGDCDDGDGDVYPGADEVCDELDGDCDEVVDEDAVDMALYYPDRDGDGFGAEGEGELACEAPAEAVAAGGDCDDSPLTGAEVNPDAEERCNGEDDDCDGALPADEVDGDGDGVLPCEGDTDDPGGGDTGDTAEDTGDTGGDSGGEDTDTGSGYGGEGEPYTIGEARTDVFNASFYFRGNAFEAYQDGTLHAFDVYLGLASDCTLDFYVHERSSSASGAWTVLWSGSVDAKAGLGYYNSGDIGLAFTAGGFYGLGVAWNCAADYYADYTAIYGHDAGIGLFLQNYWDNSYPGYSASFSPSNLGSSGTSYDHIYYLSF